MMKKRKWTFNHNIHNYTKNHLKMKIPANKKIIILNTEIWTLNFIKN